MPVRVAEVRLCNCADCGDELLGESMAGCRLPAAYAGHVLVAGRIKGRPYCHQCLSELPEDIAVGR